MSGSRRCILRPACAAGATLAAALAAPSAWALYKVIGPDGRVTYTDRLQAAPTAAVVPLREAADAGTTLPPTLRRLAERFPVTLYVAEGCGSTCDAARQLLQRRGIPFDERRVTSRAEIEAFERLSGGREAPTLAVGAQVLRGLSEPLWQQVLDAAGYPASSQLPRDYRPPAPRSLIQAAEAAASPASGSAGSRPVERATPAARAGTGGIRF